MKSEELGARKVKPVRTVAALRSQRLLRPSPHSSSSASSWDDNLDRCALEHRTFYSVARVFSLAWFILLSPEDSLTWLSVVSFHLISQLLLSGMLREILFSQANLSFLFMKKFYELTSLNPPNYFPLL